MTNVSTSRTRAKGNRAASSNNLDVDRPLVAVIRNVILIAFVVLAVGPVLWMVISSIRPAADLFQSPPEIVPRNFTGEWYSEVFRRSDAPLWFRNSLVVAVAVTLINAAVATLGAYSIVRFRYPGRRILFGGLLASYIFPPVLLLVPVFLILSSAGFVGNLFGVIAAHLITTLPFSVWLMRTFILGVPRNLEQAAMVDGCGHFGAFRRVTLPLLKTGLVATSVFAFILSWNEYLYASVISAGDTTTVPVGIASFITSFDIRWGAIMALGTAVTFPVILLFGVFQRQFEKGLTAGAIKG